jgi:hypothetical protein
MTMSANDLEAIEGLFAGAKPKEIIVADLRLKFPHLSWNQCDAADVDEPAFRSFPSFDMHLLNTTDHCAGLTMDPGDATGIILARHNVS